MGVNAVGGVLADSIRELLALSERDYLSKDLRAARERAMAALAALAAPTCAYCGEEVTDSPGEHFWGTGSSQIECAVCGKTVLVLVTTVVTYSTQKRDEVPEW